jgi:hypothetical protein
MRKALAVMIAAGLVAGAIAAPAAAGKKKRKIKKVHETFEAQALPLPNISGYTGTERRSCFAGIEDAHWVAESFTSPGKGNLKAYMEGFTGDWDLAIELPNGTLVYSVLDQTQGDAPEEEVVVPLTKGDEIQILACNFVGEPGPVQVHYEGKFKV